MKRFVITIGREFGCNASEVGRKLAARLGVKFYEKELVEKAAQIAGMDESTLYDLDRKKSDKNLLYHYVNEFGYGVADSYFSEKAVEAQAYVIRDIASRETCVMFGRCADYFLADYENVLNVFLYAPFDFRLQHVSSSYNLTVPESKKLIKKIDRRRNRWYKFVTGKNRGDRTYRHLMLSMEKFSVDDVVGLIELAAKIRFNFQED